MQGTVVAVESELSSVGDSTGSQFCSFKTPAQAPTPLSMCRVWALAAGAAGPL